jgi:cytochrome c553
MVSFGFVRCIKCLSVAAGLMVLTGIAFIYSGLYPMGADNQHTKLTFWVLETLRERSISRAAQDIEVPLDLDTPARLLRGGSDYAAMCASCHLAPDKKETDFTKGLYPKPPNLTMTHLDHGDPKDQDKQYFWIIKHGIKGSGMPAWGPGHTDEQIWNLVAFLKRLPELTPAQYQILTANLTE